MFILVFIVIIIIVVVVIHVYTILLQFNNETGLLTFTKAKVGNRGNYSCVATNPIGTTILNYETFIGGQFNDDVIMYMYIC